MYLARIAVRNLLRRRTRAIMIGGILSLAVVCFLLLESLMIALMDVSFSNAVDFETPHIEVGRSDYYTEKDEAWVLPLDEMLVPEESLLQSIQALNGFHAATPVLDFSADFIAGRYDFPVLVRAIEPESFQAVFRHHEHLTDGSFVQPGEPGIVIGDRLAAFFDLEVGDYYTLRFQDRDGRFNTIQGPVQGIFATPHLQINLNTVFLPQDQVTAPLNVVEDAASRLMIRMDERGQAVNQAEALQQSLDDSLTVRSYRDASEMLVSMEAWGYIETYFILALFLLVGAIGIAAAVVLSALERIEEIGMMKALGLRENQIVQLFLLEAAGIGAIGSILGCALAAVGIGLFSRYGLNMELFMDLEAIDFLPLAGQLYGVWNPSSFLLISAAVIVIAVLASIVPAFWAAKKDPVAAIQHR